MRQELSVGVIGYGRIGKIHLATLKNCRSIGRLSLCDPKDHELPGNILSYTKYEELLANESPDIVVICSPTPTHEPIISSCVSRGIHIFCEKPVDLDVAVIRRIEQNIEDNNIILQVGFNKRFDPDFSLLKKRIASGSLGEIFQITLFSRDPGLPPMEYIASSGGMLMDMTIHDFDMCRFLTGSEIKQVFTIGQRRISDELAEYDDIDTATSILEFQNGTICTILNSREASYGFDQRIEVFGSKGMLSVSNYPTNRILDWSSDGVAAAKPLPFFLERYATAYRLEIEAFVETVQNKNKPPVNIKDALKATEIASMANQSMKLNKPINSSILIA